MADSVMTIPRRGWALAAAMGHEILWRTSPPPDLPDGYYNSREYTRELVEQFQWGKSMGLNSLNILRGESGGLADPGGILLEQEALASHTLFSAGGHVGSGFPYWLPPTLYAKRPDLMRTGHDGKPTDTGNICTANPETLGRTVGELTKLLDRHPGASVIQIWPEDTVGGSWCNCPTCKNRSPVDQYATLIAATAGAMDARKPGIELGFLLYHDTLTGLPAQAILPGGKRFLPPNVYALFAPRERCYAHAIDDDRCARNRFYWKSLLHARDVFEGRVDVFEYYGCTTLWCYCNVAIPRVIARDLRAYRAAGVREIQALVFGAHSTWAHGLNLSVFARLASGQETDVDTAITRFTEERFGRPAAPAMLDYYNALEKAQAGYLGFCDYANDWFSDLRGFWLGMPSPAYAGHRARVAACHNKFQTLDRMLEGAARACPAKEHALHLAAEHAHLRATMLELNLLELHLAIGERYTNGGSADMTPEEEQRWRAGRRAQWELVRGVPEKIRGQRHGTQLYTGA